MVAKSFSVFLLALTLGNSENQGQSACPCSLCRTFIICLEKEGSFRCKGFYQTALTHRLLWAVAVGIYFHTIALDKMLFSTKKFSYFSTKTCCGYSLGASNGYPQHMFSWRNKKNIYLIPNQRTLSRPMSYLRLT